MMPIALIKDLRTTNIIFEKSKVRLIMLTIKKDLVIKPGWDFPKLKCASIALKFNSIWQTRILHSRSHSKTILKSYKRYRVDWSSLIL